MCLLFPNREPRKLTSAMVQYLGRQHTAAHSALGDVLATMQLLTRMVCCTRCTSLRLLPCVHHSGSDATCA